MSAETPRDGAPALPPHNPTQNVEGQQWAIERRLGEIFGKLGEKLAELTGRVEVTVKPAGKKIERLSLLSGGERSLAAVALLIAIFKARPSPFYIMDEVEAALDDANLGRLLTIFEDLRETSQLIVITHQKRTMEIADALYGVSMRADGISAVVGQRVNAERAS